MPRRILPTLWIAPIYGCVQPQDLVGPYTDYDEMLLKAREIHSAQRLRDGIFYIVVTPNRTPTLEAFTSEELPLEDLKGGA